jgi:hypothetical protein
MSLQLLPTMIIFLLTAQTAYEYILQQPGIVSTAMNESILAPLSKQTESSYSPRDLGTLELLSTSVAWLGYFLAWLAQILLLIKVLNFKHS